MSGLQFFLSGSQIVLLASRACICLLLWSDSIALQSTGPVTAEDCTSLGKLLVDIREGKRAV